MNNYRAETSISPLASDRFGRKPVMMTALLLAALTAFPPFHRLTVSANSALAAAAARAPVEVVADPGDCSLQFDPVGRATFDSSCDVAKAALASSGVPCLNRAAPPGTIAVVRVAGETIPGVSLRGLTADTRADQHPEYCDVKGLHRARRGRPASTSPHR